MDEQKREVSLRNRCYRGISLDTQLEMQPFRSSKYISSITSKWEEENQNKGEFYNIKQRKTKIYLLGWWDFLAIRSPPMNDLFYDPHGCIYHRGYYYSYREEEKKSSERVGWKMKKQQVNCCH